MNARRHSDEGRLVPAVVVAMSLSGIVLTGIAAVTFAQTQERDKIELPKAATTPATATSPLATAPTVGKAVADLRRAVLTEFEKIPFLQEQPLDSARLVVTTCDQGTVIAGAPTMRATTIGVPADVDRPVDPTRAPDATHPADPARPADPTRPVGAMTDGGEVLGALLLIGSFPRGMEVEGQPAEASYRDELAGGTFLIKRASGTRRAVQIVDSVDRVIATVPIIGLTPTDAKPSTPANASTMGASDWDEVYMSILHHFQPKLG
jgi:hypothetical protein